jgi:hypothetical protein
MRAKGSWAATLHHLGQTWLKSATTPASSTPIVVCKTPMRTVKGGDVSIFQRISGGSGNPQKLFQVVVAAHFK